MTERQQLRVPHREQQNECATALATAQWTGVCTAVKTLCVWVK